MTRKATIERSTKETQISLSLDLDHASQGSINTGIGFLDHMLDIVRVHAGIGLSVNCAGDIHVDMHHSIEDIAICLGQALDKATQNKEGLERFGFYYVTLDEALARVCLDLSGRIGFHFEGNLPGELVGQFPIEMTEHFFKTLGQQARINLHLDLIRGNNAHHCIEALFKAFARALAMAISPSRRLQGVPSSKGVLG